MCGLTIRINFLFISTMMYKNIRILFPYKGSRLCELPSTTTIQQILSDYFQSEQDRDISFITFQNQTYRFDGPEVTLEGFYDLFLHTLEIGCHNDALIALSYDTFERSTIYVKTLTGGSFRITHFSLQGTEFKERVAEVTSASCDSMRIIFAGRELRDNEKTLADYNLEYQVTLYAVFSEGL
eukprot:TRINITY_DN9632_c0_g1_i1.p1 TRINITY_DN9632_c0_g1~~TRINITY_DN9632_c0_g1_i1.p1  ORF type:complete len:182 (-),score=18.46 TRINITY_DN9632_c0_g1_i1:19-564(-)